MRIATAGCHYGLNKLSSSKGISCVSCHYHFLKKVEIVFVCVWLENETHIFVSGTMVRESVVV